MTDLYHLHIAKTGGHFFRNGLAIYVDEIQPYPTSVEGLTPHAGWNFDETKDDKYVYTSLRDPVKRLVSHYCMINYFSGPPDIIDQQSIVGEFMTWCTNRKYPSGNHIKTPGNYQARNFIFSHNKSEAKAFISDDTFKKIDKKLIRDRIQYCKIVVRDTQLNDDNIKVFAHKLSDDLNYTVGNLNLVHSDGVFANTNDFSSTFYSMLSSEQITQLQERNSIDQELYEDSSLFWNNGI